MTIFNVKTERLWWAITRLPEPLFLCSKESTEEGSHRS